jgi:hypothetical protein
MESLAADRLFLRMLPALKVPLLISLPCLIALGLLTSCGRQARTMDFSSDAELNRKLTGTWLLTRDDSDGTHWSNILIISSNNSYEARISAVRSNRVRRAVSTGTMQVQDRVLTDIVTNSYDLVGGSRSVNHTSRAEIIHLDDHEMVLKYEQMPNAVVPTNDIIFRRQ